MKIRIEGICSTSKVALTIDTSHILYVFDIYENVLPSSQLNTEKQFYVVFDPTTELQPIITTLTLSPGLRRWHEKLI